MSRVYVIGTILNKGGVFYESFQKYLTQVEAEKEFDAYVASHVAVEKRPCTMYLAYVDVTTDTLPHDIRKTVAQKISGLTDGKNRIKTYVHTPKNPVDTPSRVIELSADEIQRASFMRNSIMRNRLSLDASMCHMTMIYGNMVARFSEGNDMRLFVHSEPVNLESELEPIRKLNNRPYSNQAVPFMFDMLNEMQIPQEEPHGFVVIVTHAVSGRCLGYKASQDVLDLLNDGNRNEYLPLTK